MNSTLRILDVNFNRVREGLRVVEDGSRFFLNNPELTGKLKNLRHHFTREFFQYFPILEIKKSRGIKEDVGRGKDFSYQAGIPEIMLRNLSRTEEGLRSLEEFSKTLKPSAFRFFHQIRFKVYQLEKEINLALAKRKFPVPCLYVILNLKDNQNIFPFAEKVLAGKPDVVQLRYKGSDLPYFLNIAKRLRRIISFPTLFIINDRLDICLITKADGVHLGQKDLPVEEVRKIFPEGIIGTSATRLGEIKKMAFQPVDYIGVGALYPSPTKPEKKVIGCDILTQARKQTTIPLIGIGGITRQNAGGVLKKGAAGLAVASSIQRSLDPEKTVRLFKKLIKQRGQATFSEVASI